MDSTFFRLPNAEILQSDSAMAFTTPNFTPIGALHGWGHSTQKVDVFADNALSCKVCDKRLCHQGFEFRIVLMSMDRGLYFVHPLSFYPQKRSERNVSV